MAKTLFGFAKRVARQQIRKQVRKAAKPQKRSSVSDRKQEFLDTQKFCISLKLEIFSLNLDENVVVNVL